MKYLCVVLLLVVVNCMSPEMLGSTGDTVTILENSVFWENQ